MQTDFIRHGALVNWHDPGIGDYAPEDREDLESRIFTVVSCPSPGSIEEDSVILISDGFTEAEVLPSELTPVKTN